MINKEAINNFLFENNKVSRKRFIISSIAFFALLKIFLVLPDLYYIFGETNGLIKVEINKNYIFSYQPVLSWFSNLFAHIGISKDTSVLIFIVGYALCLCCLVINYKRPFFSIFAWLMHLILINSSFLFSYGADYLVSFALFINMFLCLSDLFNKQNECIMYSFLIRFLQIHLCIVYFFAGLGKTLGTDWLNGNAIWQVLNTYSSEHIAQTMIHSFKYPLLFTIIISWGILLLELLYPVLIYMRSTRTIALIFIILLHLFILILMRFYIFGSIMILLNIIAFGSYLTKINFRFFPRRET